MAKNTVDLSDNAEIALIKIAKMRKAKNMPVIHKKELIVFCVELLERIIENLDNDSFITLSEFNDVEDDR